MQIRVFYGDMKISPGWFGNAVSRAVHLWEIWPEGLGNTFHFLKCGQKIFTSRSYIVSSIAVLYSVQNLFGAKLIFIIEKHVSSCSHHKWTTLVCYILLWKNWMDNWGRQQEHLWRNSCTGEAVDEAILASINRVRTCCRTVLTPWKKATC